MVHFVSIKTGSNIIKHAELMQQDLQNHRLKRRRHHSRHHAPLPIQIQIALLVHRRPIRAHRLPSRPLRRMELLWHPSDGISWWSPKRNIYASQLEKVSSESDIESQENFQKMRNKFKQNEKSLLDVQFIINLWW